MNFNNKILAIVFFALLALYVMRKVLNKPEVRSIKDVLVQVDTSAVDRLIITNKNAIPIELERTNVGWTATQNNITVNATNQSINGLLSSIIRIDPLSLVSKSKEKWSDYEVDDMTGRKVEIFSNGKKIDGFYAGRFNFNQNTRSAKTYLRKADDDDVYAVDGFLSMTFDRQIDDFRDKRLFAGLSAIEINAINIKSESLSNSIIKSGNNWTDDKGSVLDSARVANYINSIPTRQSSDIELEFDVSSASQLGAIQFSDVNNNEKAVLSIYQDEGEKPFVYHSTLNPELYFRSDSTGLYKGLWLDLIELF